MSAAIFSAAGQRDVRYAMDRGLLDAADARRVLESMNELATSDPFGFSGGIKGEYEVMAGYLAEHFTGEGGRDRMLDEFTEWWGGGEDALVLAQISGMEQTEVDAAIHGYDLALERVAEIAEHGDLSLVRAEIQRIEEDVMNGEYGVLASLLMASYDRVFEMMGRVYGDFDELRDDLQVLADGGSPDSMRNAAIWYLQAIRHLEDAGSEWRSLDLIDAAEMPEPLLQATNAMRQGSEIKRCDFSILELSRDGIGLRQLAGIWESVSLLLIKAERLANAGEMDEAAASIAAAVRVCTHLFRDETPLGSLVAHDLLDVSMKLAGRLFVSEDLPDMSVDPLMTSLAAFDSGDAFGYRAANSAERILVTGTLLRPVNRADERRRRQALIRSLNEAEILYLSAMLGARHHGTYWGRDSEGDSLQPLASIIDLARLARAQDDAEAFLQSLTDERMDGVETTNWPVIVPLTERMGDTPNSLSRARELVETLTRSRAGNDH